MFDPILAAWILIWLAISSYGLSLLLYENQSLSLFYVYGKSLDVTKKKGLFWKLFLVPKSYFRHFYLIGLLTLLPCITIAILYYIPSRNQQLMKIIDTFEKLTKAHFFFESVELSREDSQQNDLTAITSLIFTLILLIIQCSRRLYESLFISVYSDSKINIIHYIFGNVFYILASISTLLPIVLSDTSGKYSLNDLMDNLVTKRRATLFFLFIYASHHQYKSHLILANLRKDKSGHVITRQHYVPAGGLFEYVSCPHFLLETILYLMIVLVQDFKFSYWNLIFALVLSTQTINALTEHRWYKKKYKEYPKERKAIFPRLL